MSKFNKYDICHITCEYYDTHLSRYTKDKKRAADIARIVFIIYDIVDVQSGHFRQIDGLYHHPGRYYILQSDILRTPAVPDGRRLMHHEWLRPVIS